MTNVPSDARILADKCARFLHDAVREGSLGAGAAVDLARRIADDEMALGVGVDDLLERAAIGSRR